MPSATLVWGRDRSAAIRSVSAAWLAAAVLLTQAGGIAPARADAFDDHISSGNQFYNEQKFAQAAREFEAAYQLKKQPDLLLNIGRIYLKLGRADAAQRNCARYLTEEFEAPPDRKAKAVDCVTKAKQILDAKKAAGAHRPVAGTAAAAGKQPGGKAPVPAADLVSPPAAAVPAQPAAPPPASAPAPLVASPAVSPSASPAAPGPASESPLQGGASPPLAPTPAGAALAPQPTLTPPSVESRPASALALQPSPGPASPRPPELVPVYKRWWFWTILGVGVAGAAAGITAGVLSTRGPAYDLGDVPPENQRTVTLTQ